MVAAAGPEVAAPSPRDPVLLAMLKSLNARSIGDAEGNDVKVPEGTPAPIERGGKLPVELADAAAAPDAPVPESVAPPLPASETADPATVAVPNPGKIV